MEYLFPQLHTDAKKPRPISKHIISEYFEFDRLTRQEVHDAINELYDIAEEHLNKIAERAVLNTRITDFLPEEDIPYKIVGRIEESGLNYPAMFEFYLERMETEAEVQDRLKTDENNKKIQAMHDYRNFLEKQAFYNDPNNIPKNGTYTPRI